MPATATLRRRTAKETGAAETLFGGVAATDVLRPVRPPEITVLPPDHVLATLDRSGAADCIILDPWYNKGVGGKRDDYHDWLCAVIEKSCSLAAHVYVCGFPEILAHQVARIPSSHRLAAWLTWYYKNCPSVIRGWRSAQNTCLHLVAQDATLHTQNFLNAEKRERWKSGRMRFVPGPPSVFETPLNIGFVGKEEQTGHPAQKPISVIEPLILMATQEEDLVLDPMCGSGTTGEACIRLNRRAVLSDASPEYTQITQDRIVRSRSECHDAFCHS